MINYTKEEFIKVCNESKSMSEAAAKLQLHYNTFKKYAILYQCWSPNQSGKGIKKDMSINSIPLYDILNGLYPEYQTYKLKNRLLKSGIKQNKCEICGLTNWNGKPIQMELHHIDGDRTNHILTPTNIFSF